MTMISSKPRLFRFTRNSTDSLAYNGAHEFAAQHALSIYAADAIYTFIPKNACSTMRLTVGMANGAIADSKDFHWIHNNNQTFRATLAELVKSKYTFAILRDSFLRVASCYLDKMVSQSQIAWEFHVSMNRQTLPAMLTFREFVTNLRPRLSGNEHWRPQADFLIYENYDDLFCYEAFPDAVAKLRERIGLDVQDARGFSKHGSERFTPIEGDELFADRPAHAIATLKRAGLIPKFIKMYDEALIAEVGELYAADIALYKTATGRPCVFMS
jgi:hypothetical protein